MRFLPLFLVQVLLFPPPGFTAETEPHAVVFMYHRFAEARHPSTSVRIDQFEAHLDWLAVHGYSVWPLEHIVRHLEADKPIPDRTAAITVDDAYVSVYRHAYPRLLDRGWPFTVFVNTDPVDQGLPDYMTWAQMREMQWYSGAFAQGPDGGPHFRESGVTVPRTRQSNRSGSSIG